jgi:predicted cupin superfamily sugar epimerase
MLTAQQIIRRLGLQPLTPEGGYFRETYRCQESVPAEALPQRYGARRCFSTAIYYLLTPQAHSRLHRVASDEVFHFLLGDPVTMLQLGPGRASRTTALGAELAAAQQPQVVVPRGVWQGCRLAPGGRFALMGVTVAPGFECDDFEAADPAALARRFPDRKDLIEQLS